MTGRLEGQVALVTGGGRGFGRAIALGFAREGAAVAVTARSRGQLDTVVDEIRASGGKAVAAAGDVTRPEDVDRIVGEAEAALGPLSLFVNNAGVPGPFGPIWDVDAEGWWNAQAVHIRAPMLFLRRIMPGMIERRAGRIIVISAIASHMVAPYMSAYCTGKIAQNRIVAQAAAEAKDLGVQVFAIDPGFVFTQLANDTLNDPAAQRWLPGMMVRLKERQAETGEGNDTDLTRCAERCIALASGRYDALTGRYTELPDDLDAMLNEMEATS